MADRNYGSLNKRHWLLRTGTPLSFQSFTDAGFRFVWRKLLSPQAWWHAIKYRGHWHFWFRRYKGLNDRCYCPVGNSLTFSIAVAGFYFTLFYSHYTGEVPCCCDRIMDEMFDRESTGVTA